MKYDENKYFSAVKYYKQKLVRFKGLSFLVIIPIKNEKAFYALAPLSNAIHEIDAEMNVKLIDENNKSIKILRRIWKTFNELKKGEKNEKTKALKEFIETVNKKTKSTKFEKIFSEPEIIITAKKNWFEVKGKNFNATLELKNKWFKKYRQKELSETNKKIIEQYKLKKHEIFGIVFELIPGKNELELPLEDYLDNFAIARSFALEAKKKAKKIIFSSSTRKFSRLAPMERISDLTATIAGCEYDKKVKEKIFVEYKKLSEKLKLNELEYASAVFGIHGKGYSGKHFFGMTIGYPDLKCRTRWSSITKMRLKPWWVQQSKIDKRSPTVRLAITETLPIDNFINTCNVDYKLLRKKNLFIKKVLERNEKLHVKGNKKIAGYKTNLTIDLRDFNEKGNRSILPDDGKMDSLIDIERLKKYDVKSGLFGNFPAGECFMTPKDITGEVVSEVVINVDQSYVIPKNNPVVLRLKKGKYKIINAPEFIKMKIRKELKESKKLIKEFEKNNSLPKEVINEYKKNFHNIGEFSINTNPKAKLSRYLIETEKIAKMMHIAMGSGFEPNTQTLYHWDTVINSVNQKIDVYATDKKGKKQYIIKKGIMQFKK